jgi:hypothetical protein
MAKFRLPALRQLHVDLGKILSDYDDAKAAEAGETDGARLERADQPGAQDHAIDVRSKGLTHIPNTPAVQALRALPGYDRLSKRPELPALSPDFFAKS